MPKKDPSQPVKAANENRPVDKEKAALVIQTFFASFRKRKKITAQYAIFTNQASDLLRAFDLRFQCMRAVAAAKFPINKPIEDAQQVSRVIASIKELAKVKGIRNLDAVERIFRHSILLAERIQAPYYYQIWKKTYPSNGVNSSQLINKAYQQLCSIAQSFDLSIACNRDKRNIEPTDVLNLAREIIQHASNLIIEALAKPQLYVHTIASDDFSKTFEKMLAEYMTPKVLAHSKDNIQSMTEEIRCALGKSKL